MNLDDIVVVGITGGFASGKSTAAKLIAEKGFKVSFTDDRAKFLMSEKDKIKQKIISAFGNEAYIDGKLNNQYLASLVFGEDKESAKRREKLESIVHPAVIDDMIALIEEYAASGNKLIFVESAILFEAGISDGFDYIINIAAPKDQRINRAVQHRGFSEQDAMKKIQSQMSDEERAGLADFSIDNNKTVKDLQQSIEFLLPILTHLPPKNFEDDENE